MDQRLRSSIHTSTTRRRRGRVGESTTTTHISCYYNMMFLAVLCLVGGAARTTAFTSHSATTPRVRQINIHHERQRQTQTKRNVWASSSRLFATPDPSEQPSLPTPLIPMDQDSENDDTVDDSITEASSFYEIEYLDDDTDDDKEILNEQESEEVSLPEITRREAKLLEEQEDRLYVDAFGIKRKIETCILVGVEDQSARRRDVRDRRNMPDDQDGYEQTAAPVQRNGKKNDDGVYFTLEESMTEMRELIKTSGLELVGEMIQRLNEIVPRTYIGTGKVIEVQELLKEKGSCTVIFDAELSPGQQRSLENAFNKDLLQNDFLGEEIVVSVVDRTALILDIFAQHAKTREGKLQVDLALNEYRKPRLTKMWTHLERQSGSGGVGLRGPGETQLEIDRRLVRDRIITLKKKIDDVQQQRAIHRRGRDRTGLPVLSLVGYTNAGKSTLLNYLTRAGVMADSMLFATLDPTTRKVKLPGFKTHPEVLLTDTVGFIQKLPTQLVAAFRATLEEVSEADVLIHVIDVSNPTWEKQERSVQSVLADIGCADKPMVRVLNKIDLLDPEEAEKVRYEAVMTPNTVAVSSLQGEGMQDFVAVVEEALADMLVQIEVEIPYTSGDELNIVHEQGNVEVVDYREKGTYVRALVPAAVANRLEKYNASQTPSASDETDGDDDIDWVALGRGRHSATSNK